MMPQLQWGQPQPFYNIGMPSPMMGGMMNLMPQPNFFAPFGFMPTMMGGFNGHMHAFTDLQI